MPIHGSDRSIRLLFTSILALALTSPGTAQETEANCVLQFDATWSAQTHPIDFPPDAHFSPLIGGNHDHETVFWQEGDLATPGIKSVAETGSTTLLQAEVNAAIANGSAESVILGGGAGAPGSTQVDFDLSLEFPRITLVTMIAPSPDWFVGVNGLNLFESGRWRPMTIVDLLPYDAGTDSGGTFTSPNQPTIPPEPIFEITENPFPDGVPLGTFSIACDSPLVFFDGFESGDLSNWSNTR